MFQRATNITNQVLDMLIFIHNTGDTSIMHPVALEYRSHKPNLKLCTMVLDFGGIILLAYCKFKVEHFVTHPLFASRNQQHLFSAKVFAFRMFQ